MLKRAVLLLGMTAAALGLLMAPTSASPANNPVAAQTTLEVECPSGPRICLWSDKDYHGIYGAWPGQANQLGSLDNQVSSVINRLSSAIVLNFDTNQGRAALCIAQFGAISDLSVTFYNDQFSSVGVLPGPFCR